MDKIIERALSHWYTPDHELYGDPLPALMGIVGESGELCDIWKKKLYKPGYVFDRDVFLDELGDCLFYAAVLCHYDGITIEHIHSLPVALHIGTGVGSYVKWINYWSASWWAAGDHNTINIIKSIECICLDFNITLDQLSELNYAKLNERATNGTGYNRGEDKHDNLVICNHHSKCGQICQGEHKNPHSAYDDCVLYLCGDFEKVECVPVVSEKKSEFVICEFATSCNFDECEHIEQHKLMLVKSLDIECTELATCTEINNEQCKCIPYTDDECSDKKDYDTCENEYICSHDCAVCKGLY